ncbi:MAG: hypothetical protein A4E73_01712 [Syntrophaceae bacterium PtaU1.Bin231]|nr:MAG: hypothetical protein A4E73_01712 [Syntrophaceae bacterium PtaU1.Bin231]
MRPGELFQLRRFPLHIARNLDAEFGVAEDGAVIERHVAIGRVRLAVVRPDQGIHLNGPGIVIAEDPVEAPDRVGEFFPPLLFDLHPGQKVADPPDVQSVDRIDQEFPDTFGVSRRDLLDSRSALRAEDKNRRLDVHGRVHDDADIVLVGDFQEFLDKDLGHGKSLDVRLQDLPGPHAGFLRRIGELDPAGLEPPRRPHLRLDHHAFADPAGDFLRLLRRRRDFAPRNSKSGSGEQLLPLMFVNSCHEDPFLLFREFERRPVRRSQGDCAGPMPAGNAAAGRKPIDSSIQDIGLDKAGRERIRGGGKVVSL